MARTDAEIEARLAELGLDLASLTPAFELVSLAKPESSVETEMITGEDDEDAGRKLALRLREARVI